MNVTLKYSFEMCMDKPIIIHTFLCCIHIDVDVTIYFKVPLYTFALLLCEHLIPFWQINNFVQIFDSIEI